MFLKVQNVWKETSANRNIKCIKKCIEHTLIVHVISVQVMKLPDKPKGYQHLSAWQKKPMQQAQAVALIQLLG